MYVLMNLYRIFSFFRLFAGLKLAFNIELDEYIPQLTADAGIKVLITQHREMPFPTYSSLSLAPGFYNQIAVKRVILCYYSACLLNI